MSRDNPSAFPAPVPSSGGMSLREWYAGQALPAAITIARATLTAGGYVNGELARAAAAIAWAQADAMMAGRDTEFPE